MTTEVILLGIVEGLTEFLPVSSTGHLIILDRLLGLGGEKQATFDIFIQLGAILAVVVHYRKRFQKLLNFSTPSSALSFEGPAGILKLAIATMPALIIGAVLHKWVKTHLFGVLPVSIGLIVWGVVILLVERRNIQPKVKGLDFLTLKQCLVIGLFQCFALWPGTSRSAATIIGAALLGVERRIAVEFSFFLAVPTLCAAVAFDLFKSRHLLSASDTWHFGLGFVVSFVAATLGIRFFLGLLSKYDLKPFAYYRIVLGLIVLGFLG